MLVVFIGLVALSLVGVAAVTAAVGIQMYKLLIEVRVLVKKVHAVGNIALSDYQQLRAKVHAESLKARGIVHLALSVVSRAIYALRPPARAKREKAE